MKRTKSLERYFYAADYEAKIKSKLTKKQFLVYTYLLANSKWNANSDERHYYIYFNSFTVSGAAQQIGISRPTWNSAIEKLRKENLIIKMDGKRQITLEHEKEEPSLKFSGDHYRITFPETNAPLNIKLISYLLEFSLFLNNSGNIVGVYSTLYQYWNSCMNNNSKCCISINQLLKLFETNYNKIAGKYYEMLMCLFSALGLISLKMTKKFYMGQSYTEYEILFMNVSIPDNLEAKSYGPDDIEEIIKAIENSI